MSVELRCEIVNTDKRDKKRTKHYLKNLCIHYECMYIALIRGEIEFSRKIKMLQGKDIKNKTAEIEISIKVRAYEWEWGNSLLPYTSISHISTFRYMIYYFYSMLFNWIW